MMTEADIKFRILRAIGTLTPPNCQECSSQEVAALLFEDGVVRNVRSVATLIRGYKNEGLILSRHYMQRQLWKLSAKGARVVKEFERDRARQNRKRG